MRGFSCVSDPPMCFQQQQSELSKQVPLNSFDNSGRSSWFVPAHISEQTRNAAASAAANEISPGAGFTQRIIRRYDVTSAVSRAPAERRAPRHIKKSYCWTEGRKSCNNQCKETCMNVLSMHVWPCFHLDVVHALDKNDVAQIAVFWSSGPVNQLIRYITTCSQTVYDELL